MPQPSAMTLESRAIGPDPVVRRMFERLDLQRLLETYVPGKSHGRRRDLSHGRALAVMVQNLVLSRAPLYRVAEWLKGRDPALCGLADDAEAALLQDDRIARALDALYAAEPASLMTAVVVRAVKEFGIDLSQLHNDSTTVTFSGAYAKQQPADAADRPPLITFGHNKDHRPDLKQLVYALTISADGAVPVHYKTWDGNVTDDRTHQQTWDFVRSLAGRADFVYVADSKLCTKENLQYLHARGGRFVTVLPRSRKEDDEFRAHVRSHAVPWEEVLREPNPRGAELPPHVYRAYQPPERAHDGHRLVWFVSSEKAEHDQRRRARRIERARRRLEELEARTGAHRFRSVAAAREAVDKVLGEEGAARWLDVAVAEHTVAEHRQVGAGRPGPHTRYRRTESAYVMLEIKDRAEAVLADAACDGLFAMVTNLDDATPRAVLDLYKYQPFLEKRNEQLKSVLAVAPVFLKKPKRVAALLFLYFLAVLVHALIEREVRRGMKKARRVSLPLYPEGRPAKSPTTALVLQALEPLRRHRLLDGDGNVVRVFYDALPETALTVLRLLRVDLRHYGADVTS